MGFFIFMIKYHKHPKVENFKNSENPYFSFTKLKVQFIRLFQRTKNTKKPLVRQMLNLVPNKMLVRCVDQYKSDKGSSKYKTQDQFVALSFGCLCKKKQSIPNNVQIDKNELLLQN